MLSYKRGAGLLLLCGAARAQGPVLGSPAGFAEPNAQIAISNVGFEVLGQGDLIYLAVASCPEVTRSYRISANGDIVMPLIAAPVHAAGLMPAELEKTVAALLVENRILVEPSVSLSVLE